MSYVVLFEQLRMTDVDSVGGKNASLDSQLSGAGVRVPGGFATTADAFRDFLKASGLDKRIAERLTTLNPEDVRELANAGSEIRQWIVDLALQRPRHFVPRAHAHADVALSAGIQRMVRSDKGSAGVMFTIDTESGFQDVVFITSSGLGETTVVQGAVNPDEFYVFKPTLGSFPHRRPPHRSKLIKMEFDPERPGGRAVRTVDVPVSEHRNHSLTDDGQRAGPRRHHRKALRPPDGHRVGPRRHRRQDLHPAGPSRDGEVATGRQ